MSWNLALNYGNGTTADYSFNEEPIRDSDNDYVVWSTGDLIIGARVDTVSSFVLEKEVTDD